MDDFERDRLIRVWQEKARRAAKKHKRRNLYVITLDPEVLWDKKFRQVNPGYIEGAMGQEIPPGEPGVHRGDALFIRGHHNPSAGGSF